MDRFEELRILTAILDCGSLAAAARRLRRSSPAVTRALSSLERRVGTRLVERTTRHLSPTDAGRRLAAQARNLLAGYREAVGGVSQQYDAPLRGLLRVTAPSLFGRWHIAPLVCSFLDAHPGMQVELILTNDNLDLVSENIDVSVRIGLLADSSLVARRVGQVRAVTFASPDYLERRGRPRTPRDLTNHDIVFISRRPSPIEWRFKVADRWQAVRLKPSFMATDIATVLDAVKRGRGVGRTLSYQVASDFSSGSLVRILTKFEPDARSVQLVVPSARHMLPSVRSFLDHAAHGLGSLREIRE